MKTNSIQLVKVSFILIFVMICGAGFSQKSVNYPSVGENLEEIQNFFDDTCNKAEKYSARMVTELESLVEKTKKTELVEKVTDWGQVQLKDLNDAAQEAKVWLSRQTFAPVKQTRAAGKDLAKQD